MWTKEDEDQAEDYCDAVMERRLPKDCCTSCGDYAGPGKETCERCDRAKAANSNIPEQRRPRWYGSRGRR
jgi:uncharacterized OB-fold protein